MKKNFQKRWLESYKWLKYDSDKQLMKCTLCAEAKFSNAMAQGTDNIRISKIDRHIKFEEHQRILNKGKSSQNLKQKLATAVTGEEEAVISAMKIVYWLAKESLPLSKFKSLMTLLSRVGYTQILH